MLSFPMALVYCLLTLFRGQMEGQGSALRQRSRGVVEVGWGVAGSWDMEPLLDGSAAWAGRQPWFPPASWKSRQVPPF